MNISRDNMRNLENLAVALEVSRDQNRQIEQWYRPFAYCRLDFEFTNQNGVFLSRTQLHR